MVESLITGRATLVNIEDRTQVISLKEWNITHNDVLHIFDHGGHFVYSITTPLFIAKDSIIFIVHDITKIKPEDMNKTTEILRQAFYQYPENKMYIIFTHTDLTAADEMACNSDFLMGTLKQFLDDEISNLNKLIIEKQSALENRDIVDETAKLLKHFKDKRSHLPFFCVSSENFSGMIKVKEFLVKAVKEIRTVVPKLWLAFYKEIIETKRMYLTLEETSELFKKTLVSDSADANNFSDTSSSGSEPAEASPALCHEETTAITTNTESDYLVPLQYFSDSSLCLYYENNPFLKDYVFPDIDSLGDLFKSMFHHNLTQVINYDKDEKLQANFRKGECDLAVQRYEKEGLLSRKLFCHLLEHYGFSSADEIVLLHLMEQFNLCYSISKNRGLLYIPWFVQSQECPAHIDREQLMKFDKGHASVHLQCEFFNRIPLNVFEMVSVCLQRKATEESHYIGDRHAWHDGLEVSFGSVRCVLTRSKNSTIDICLCGEVNDMPQVWRVIESLLQDLKKTLKPWNGIIKSIHFVCGHCVIQGILTPQCWVPEFVFPEKNKMLCRYVECPKNPSMEVPAALLIHVFKGKILHAMSILYHQLQWVNDCEC